MTFAHYEFDRGATIHEHRPIPEEEVYEVLEGVLEDHYRRPSRLARPARACRRGAGQRRLLRQGADRRQGESSSTIRPGPSSGRRQPRNAGVSPAVDPLPAGPVLGPAFARTRGGPYSPEGERTWPSPPLGGDRGRWRGSQSLPARSTPQPLPAPPDRATAGLRGGTADWPARCGGPFLSACLAPRPAGRGGP